MHDTCSLQQLRPYLRKIVIRSIFAVKTEGTLPHFVQLHESQRSVARIIPSQNQLVQSPAFCKLFQIRADRIFADAPRKGTFCPELLYSARNVKGRPACLTLVKERNVRPCADQIGQYFSDAQYHISFRRAFSARRSSTFSLCPEFARRVFPPRCKLNRYTAADWKILRCCSPQRSGSACRSRRKCAP